MVQGLLLAMVALVAGVEVVIELEQPQFPLEITLSQSVRLELLELRVTIKVATVLILRLLVQHRFLQLQLKVAAVAVFVYQLLVEMEELVDQVGVLLVLQVLVGQLQQVLAVKGLLEEIR